MKSIDIKSLTSIYLELLWWWCWWVKQLIRRDMMWNV